MQEVAGSPSAGVTMTHPPRPTPRDPPRDEPPSPETGRGLRDFVSLGKSTSAAGRWTVIDQTYRRHCEADAFLLHLRFAADAAEVIAQKRSTATA